MRRRRSFLAPVLAAVAIVGLVVTAPTLAPHVTRALENAATPRPDEPADHTFLFHAPDGTHARWDPCSPVHYAVNPAGAPAAALRVVDEAFARMGRETGMTFVRDANTDEPPSVKRDAFQPKRYGRVWAPVLVSWVAQPSVGIEIGSGAPLAVAAAQGERFVIVTGTVKLSRTATLRPGFETASSWGAVLLHEVGHVLGLGHATQPTQLMYPRVSERPSSFGRGDLAGLKALGREAGCQDVPRPQPVPTT